MSPEKSPLFNVQVLRDQISRTEGDADTVSASEHGIAYHKGNVENAHARFHSLIVIHGHAKHAGATHESEIRLTLPEGEIAEEVHAESLGEVWVNGDAGKVVAQQDGKIYISGKAHTIEVIGNGVVMTGYAFSEEDIQRFNL